MKYLILTLALSLTGLYNSGKRPDNTEKINKILHSNRFVISLEWVDLGYIQDIQSYLFEDSGSVLRVTSYPKDSTLDHSPINTGITDSLNNYLSGLTSFETRHPRRVARKFNRNWDWDFLHIYNDKDTVVIYDHTGKAETNLQRMIKNNVR